MSFDGLCLDLAEILIPFGGGAPVVILPRSLRAAIKADWVHAGLTETVGPLHALSAGISPAVPYVTFEVTNEGTKLFSALGKIDVASVAFRCTASTPEAAETMAQALDSWMVPVAAVPIGREFAWTGAYAAPAVRGNRMDGEDPWLSVGNKRIFFEAITYRILFRGGF